MHSTVRARRAATALASFASLLTPVAGRAAPTEAVETLPDGWALVAPPPEATSACVTALLADGEDLWVGTEDGLWVWRDGTWRRGAEPGDLPFPFVTSLALSPRTGTLWVGTLGGVARGSGGRWDVFTQNDSGLPSDVVYDLCALGDDVWVATALGLGVHHQRLGGWDTWTEEQGVLVEPWCVALAADDDRVYCGLDDAGVVVFDPSGEVQTRLFDPDGDDGRDLAPDDGLLHDTPTRMACTEGALWVGTFHGLSRFDGETWRDLRGAPGGPLPSPRVTALFADGPRLWVGTDAGLAEIGPDREATFTPDPESGVRAVLHRRDGSRAAARLSGALPPGGITAIARTGGTLWLGTTAGLVRAEFREVPTRPLEARPGAPVPSGPVSWPGPLAHQRRPLPAEPAPCGREVEIGIVTSFDEGYELRLRGGILATIRATRLAGDGGPRFGLWSQPTRGGRPKAPWLSAADNARRLVFEAGCAGLLAAPSREVSRQMARVAERTRTMLVTLSSDSSLTRSGNPWVVQAVPDDRAQMRALLASLAERPERMPAIVPAGRDGRSVREDLGVLEGELGIAFEPVIEVPMNGPEPGGLEGIAADRERPLIAWMMLGDVRDGLDGARAVARELVALGWQGPVLLPNRLLVGLRGTSWMPEALEGRGVLLFDPEADDPLVREYVAECQEVFDAIPDEGGALARDAASLLCEAVLAVGCDRDAVRAWIAGLEAFHGVTGTWRFDEHGRRVQPLRVTRF